MKLDIGAGEFPISTYGGGDGWTTVDLYQPADVQADMAALPFDDGTVDEIWSSHALEHVERERIPAILAEWFRVLTPNGRLGVMVPDMDFVARRWLDAPDDPMSLPLLFGTQAGEGQFHRTGWNVKTLERDLAMAGFVVEDIERIWSHDQDTLRARCIRPRVKAVYVPPPPMDQLTDKVLVACPTYSGMAYCLPEYLEAYAALIWSNRGLMIVDNTRDEGAWAESVRPSVETDNRRHLRHVEPLPTFEATFHRSWRVILDHAEFNGYDFVLSLEQDVIIPPLALDALLNVSAYCKAPFVSHMYPFHHGRSGLYEGLGCVLMSTKLLRTALDVSYKTIPYVEAAIYDCAVRVSHMTLRDLFEVRHLDAPPGVKPWQYERTNDAAAVMIEVA